MKIIVVEDDKKIAKFVKRGLEEEGYEVDVVYDGEEGYQKIHDGSYGLVILDLMLKKKEGLTLLAEMRGKNILTPVLIVSANDTIEDIVVGLDAGADDYLGSPQKTEKIVR